MAGLTPLQRYNRPQIQANERDSAKSQNQVVFTGQALSRHRFEKATGTSFLLSPLHPAGALNLSRRGGVEGRAAG